MSEAKPPRTLANAGFADVKKLPKGPNGMNLCRWCAKECPSKKRTFCSGARATFVYRVGSYIKQGEGCVHEHCLRSDSGYARKCVWARDKGQCALCPTVCVKGGHSWQMDHITPVSEGGGSCGLENLRTLCTACHKKETAKLAGRRAEARRASLAEAETKTS